MRVQIAYHRAYAEHRSREGLGDELAGLLSPEQFPSRLCNLLLQVHMYTSCLVPTCCSSTLEALGQHPSGAALGLVSCQHRPTPADCTTCTTGCALCCDPCQLAQSSKAATCTLLFGRQVLSVQSAERVQRLRYLLEQHGSDAEVLSRTGYSWVRQAPAAWRAAFPGFSEWLRTQPRDPAGIGRAGTGGEAALASSSSDDDSDREP